MVGDTFNNIMKGKPLGKSCVFFGHRWLAFKVEERNLLKKTIIDLIEKENVEDFVFGGYGDFDSIAFEVVSEIKKDYPKIRRILALAYIPRYQADMDRLNLIYEHVYLPEGTEVGPQKYAITRRNRALAKECDYMICYVLSNSGGSYSAMHTAQVNNKKVINLAKNFLGR